MSSWRGAAAGVLFVCASLAYAQPPIASFASGQLQFAESALERARAAQAAGDAALARRYAAQAELDARLAWSMSHSAHMRRAAADVARGVARLRHELVTAANRGQGRNTASSPTASLPTTHPPRPANYDPDPNLILQLPDLPSVDLSSPITRR